MKIGNVELENNIFLAPMAGVTDLPFRRMCKKYGCGFTYSEMVSAKGLYYKDKKTDDLMRLCEEEKPCAIQIFGSEPDIMSHVVGQVESKGAAVVDINMGCPTPKIVNNKDGCALMKNPLLAGRIMRAVKDASSVPVTAKIRKGWDSESENAVQMAKILEENGADAIAVHPRTREQFYSGNADWSVIKEVVSAVNIPVIGNGDIFSAHDALRMIDETGCAAVMVARGAQGNPFIFRQINELFKTGRVEFRPTDEDRVNAAIELVCDLVAQKGESRGIKEARKHISWFIKGMKYSAEIKRKIFTLTKKDDVITTLSEIIF